MTGTIFIKWKKAFPQRIEIKRLAAEGKHQRGFTLPERLTVVAVIGILASLLSLTPSRALAQGVDMPIITIQVQAIDGERLSEGKVLATDLRGSKIKEAVAVALAH